jgi:hypothetical protein
MTSGGGSITIGRVDADGRPQHVDVGVLVVVERHPDDVTTVVDGLHLSFRELLWRPQQPVLPTAQRERLNSCPLASASPMIVPDRYKRRSGNV